RQQSSVGLYGGPATDLRRDQGRSRSVRECRGQARGFREPAYPRTVREARADRGWSEARGTDRRRTRREARYVASGSSDARAGLDRVGEASTAYGRGGDSCRSKEGDRDAKRTTSALRLF